MSLRLSLLAHALIAVATLSAQPVAAENLPVGFTDTPVTNIALPTALAFTPDGRLLVTTQNGTLRVVQGTALLPVPAIAFVITGNAATLCMRYDSGLLGVTVDPDFTTNHYVYLYFTRPQSSPGNCDGPKVNRVSRFVLPASNLIDPASETVLVDGIPNPIGYHAGGDLGFGHDGYLYVSVGDGACDYAGDSGCWGLNDAARDRNTLIGKILRVDRNGNVPPDNPFSGAGTASCRTGNAATGRICREAFAWGLRNPYRFAFDPNATGTRLFINDVGQEHWEEIDTGQSGADYGWSVREGNHRNPESSSTAHASMVDPLFDYAHGDQVPGTASSGCGAVTGGAFVPNGLWSASFDGSYLFADYVCGSIFRLDAAGAAHDFVRDLGGNSAAHMSFSPAGAGQALYYTSYAGGGAVRRIRYTGARRRPALDFDGNGVADVVVYRSGAWLTFSAP